MKLVIDIPEDMYKDANILIVKDLPELKRAIADGTPLPKGHGDLIDRDALIQKQFIPNQGFELVELNDLKIAPTVIPADKK